MPVSCPGEAFIGEKEIYEQFCEGFGHIDARNCRNRGEEGSIPMPSNKFEVLKSRVMNVGEGSGREIGKDRKTRDPKEY